MKLGVFALGTQNQNVIGFVVSLIAVDMVNNFPGNKRASENGFGDPSVFVPPVGLAIGRTLADIDFGFVNLPSNFRSHTGGVEPLIDPAHVFTHVRVVLECRITVSVVNLGAELVQALTATEIVSMDLTRATKQLLSAPVTFDAQFHQ